MTVLSPKIHSHQELIHSVDNFLQSPEKSPLPQLSSGRMEFQLYKAALVIDTFISRLETVIEETKLKAASIGRPVTCGKGCDACCSQPISGSLFEAVLIQLYLESDPAKKEQFLTKYETWRSSIGNPQEYSRTIHSGILAKIMGEKDASDYDRKAVEEFNLNKDLGCPFLEEHCCSIYPARPIVCRQLLSVDDPLKCQKGEKALILMAGDIDYLLIHKLSPLLIHLGNSFGFSGIVSSITPIAVHELLINPERYIENTLQEYRRF